MFCEFINKTRGSLSRQMGSLAVHTTFILLCMSRKLNIQVLFTGPLVLKNSEVDLYLTNPILQAVFTSVGAVLDLSKIT